MHAMMTDLPVALVAVAVLWDIAAIADSDGVWADIAFWTLAAGLGFGLLIAAGGLLDFFGLVERDSPAKNSAIWHMTAMVVVLALVGASLAVRYTAADPIAGADRILAYALSWAGAAALAVGAWLGGELVYRHGIGQKFHGHENDARSTTMSPVDDETWREEQMTAGRRR